MTDVTNDEQEGTVDDFTLQSLGTYMLFDQIDNETSQDMCEFLIKSNILLPEELELSIYINSPGGCVYSSFAIIDLLKASKLKIKTIGTGVIASMAALIFISGEKGKRVLTKNAFIMTHQFNQVSEGKYHEILAQRSHEDDIHNRFVAHFKEHTNMSEQQIKDVILGSSDKWITPEQALEYGMCDAIDYQFE
jgi:ATP-dependent Clp protease protease subunit